LIRLSPKHIDGRAPELKYDVTSKASSIIAELGLRNVLLASILIGSYSIEFMRLANGINRVWGRCHANDKAIITTLKKSALRMHPSGQSACRKEAYICVMPRTSFNSDISCATKTIMLNDSGKATLKQKARQKKFKKVAPLIYLIAVKDTDRRNCTSWPSFLECLIPSPLEGKLLVDSLVGHPNLGES
jgi:hypothetical protein